MNQLKSIAYIAEITWDEWSYKIVKFLRRISDYFDEDLRKERELEQQRRHQEASIRDKLTTISGKTMRQER